MRTNTDNRRSRRTDRGKIHADPATLLHRHGRFAKMLKNTRQVVRDRAHHKAIEQRYIAAGSRAGKDAARRDELEVGECVPEP